MQLRFASLILLLAAPSVLFAQNESSHRTEWGAWARAFSSYAAHPTATNAEALWETFLPSAPRDSTAIPPSFDSVETWLAVLARRVKARDAAAVRLAFEIEPHMGSGDFSETLDIMLGELIRIDPRLFLTELRAQEQRQGWVGVPGANLGEDFVDNFQAQCRELHLRARALQGISDSAVAIVKRRAIARLNSAAQEVCSN